MSGITPHEIKDEFLKSKMGITGISILIILVLTSIITVVGIPVETFQEWNNPGNWIIYESRLVQRQGVYPEAVVNYCEGDTTQAMC